jgi:hypothetical protein
MIIVEGPDGAGKSTLVERLSEHFGYEVGKRATEDRDLLYTVTRQDTWTALGVEVSGFQEPRIYDRLFFSEMVYAPVVERPCEFNITEQSTVRRILAALGCPVIVCRPGLEAVLHNVSKSKHEMAGVRERITTIYADYVDLMDRAGKGGVNILYYDYTGEQTGAAFRTFENLCQVIDHYADKRKEREWNH